jgi:hypothetical protein
VAYGTNGGQGTVDIRIDLLGFVKKSPATKVRKKERRGFAPKVERTSTYFVCEKENRSDGENFNFWTRRGAGQDAIHGK